MNTANQHHRDYRKRKAAELPYYRVQHTLPLGETPAVAACLHSEGLSELVTADLREVYYYKVDQNKKRREFCAVGWPNENGGWEIRHPNFTGCLGPKGMTFISGEAGHLVIFEEFTAYLYWRYFHKQYYPNILILNYPEFLGAAKMRALKFNSVTVCFDQEQITLIKSSGDGFDPINAAA
ncbi:hypothetical protein GCM10011500_08610 [Mucilaginibacter rubeus]|nr:hypothetical protein GCM10011500_08610 [Mucilaginibacter rubeus]